MLVVVASFNRRVHVAFFFKTDMKIMRHLNDCFKGIVCVIICAHEWREIKCIADVDQVLATLSHM